MIGQNTVELHRTLGYLVLCCISKPAYLSRQRISLLLALIVTIPPLDPSARDEEEPDYDEEAQVWATAMEHAAEVEDEEMPDEYDWQVSRLVSAATYTAGPDAGRVSTGRMKIT